MKNATFGERARLVVVPQQGSLPGARWSRVMLSPPWVAAGTSVQGPSVAFPGRWLQVWWCPGACLSSSLSSCVRLQHPRLPGAATRALKGSYWLKALAKGEVGGRVGVRAGAWKWVFWCWFPLQCCAALVSGYLKSLHHLFFGEGTVPKASVT